MKQVIEGTQEPDNESAKKTLAAIADLLNENAVDPMHALNAAYTLGVFEGQLKMARVGTSRD